MSATNAIRDSIRSNFAFLAHHGFVEVEPSPRQDEVYAEVQFEKGNWRIAIFTMSHGTKITLRIISPDGESGVLSYLADSEGGKDVISDIQSKAKFLRKYGTLLLLGDSEDFELVFNNVIERHLKRLDEHGMLKRKV